MAGDLGAQDAVAEDVVDRISIFNAINTNGVRKFSGSAFREKQDRAFHHGTMLMSADLARLGNILTPNPKKLLAKGTESVRARVLNLNELNPELNHEAFTSELINRFEEFYSKEKTIEILNIESLKKIPQLKVKFEELSSWDWVYGKALPFNHQMSEYFKLGLFEFQFVVEDGQISSVKVYSDSLYPLLIEELQALLQGVQYTAMSIDGIFAKLKTSYGDLEGDLNEVQIWLKKQIEI